MTYELEFKAFSDTDSIYDTSEDTNALKARCSSLAQDSIDALASNRLQDLPQQELGAVIRELRTRGIVTRIHSPNREDAIVEYSE